jgi:CHAD domain-containing protein
MHFDQERGRELLRKLERRLAKMSEEPAAKQVHGFRTYSRRAEALLHELEAEPSGNTKKLLKGLGKLRKKAGRVRDLDVQTAALQGLKLPQAAAQKAQLLRSLHEEREKRARKLAKELDKKTVAELRRRTRKAASELAVPEDFDPLQRALRQVRQVGRSQHQLDEETLHQYRIAGKRARYLAELAGEDAEAARVVGELTRMQDVIGDWHDWLKLTEQAEKLFGGPEQSTLVAVLSNVTRAKFQQSTRALQEMRAALLKKSAPPAKPVGRYQAVSAA